MVYLVPCIAINCSATTLETVFLKHHHIKLWFIKKFFSSCCESKENIPQILRPDIKFSLLRHVTSCFKSTGNESFEIVLWHGFKFSKLWTSLWWSIGTCSGWDRWSLFRYQTNKINVIFLTKIKNSTSKMTGPIISYNNFRNFFSPSQRQNSSAKPIIKAEHQTTQFWSGYSE